MKVYRPFTNGLSEMLIYVVKKAGLLWRLKPLNEMNHKLTSHILVCHDEGLTDTKMWWWTRIWNFDMIHSGQDRRWPKPLILHCSFLELAEWSGNFYNPTLLRIQKLDIPSEAEHALGPCDREGVLPRQPYRIFAWFWNSNLVSRRYVWQFNMANTEQQTY